MKKLKLTQRYIPALLLIIIFTILSYVVSENIIKSNNEYAKIINISGKQRMLSQRLVILANGYIYDSTPKDKMLSSIKEMENAHNYLLEKIYNQKLHNIYFRDNLDNNLKKYLTNFYSILTTKDETHLKAALKSSTSILHQLDLVVKEYESYANQQLNKLRDYELYLTIFALIVLLLEALFIFKPAAQEIELSQQELKKHYIDYEDTLLETSNSAIIAINCKGEITTFNKKAEELFGWSKDEIIGRKRLAKLIPKEYRKAHLKSSFHYLKTGISSGIINKSHELKGLKKDGTIFPLRVSIGGKWKNKNTVVVATITDMTWEKENEAILEQQSKMASMGDMIGNIAHQWRQPLSVISTAASGLQIKKEYGILEDKFLDETLVQIENNAQYLSKTIDTFRDFIKEKKEYKEVVLQDRINKSIDIINTALQNNYIKLYSNINEIEDINIKLVIGELSQVLINILNNAKDAIKENNINNPWIKLELEKTTDYAIITIEDNAGGIPKNVMPNIFAPYFTTKHQSQGTGLGLHMSYKIITESLKGKIYAKNTQYGAKFFIELPLS
ncbi:MAG: ATP-binding protein [Campylobacterota bacterium]|nr:ATP-binding protein [Campylobacterota bacterium]